MMKNNKVRTWIISEEGECEDCLILLKDLHISWDKIMEMWNPPDKKSWNDVIVIGSDEEK